MARKESELLRVSNLTKTFTTGGHSFNAVDNVHLTVGAGTFVALMGPSGSGKSTFLNLIGGIERPSAGTIRVGDRQIESLSEDELAVMRRRDVSFIYQFFGLVPDLTAAENIVLPRLIAGDRRPAWIDRLSEILDLVGLADKRDHLPAQLSGGEQQRVGVARALLTKPSLLLADEPTGSLDARQGQRIMDILRRSVDTEEQTILLVTHDAKVAGYADRTIFFRDGRIVDDVSADPLDTQALADRLSRPDVSERTP
jgi:putative ABC transport system ATP-binding protein